MKKVDSAIASDNAAGDGWFKIWDESYDEAAGKWCTNKMIENDGHISVTIPSDIEGGYYLVRPELLALHFAVNDPPDPQFYVGCAQIYLDSTGAAKPATISIPENYVDMSMPAMTFNIYDRPLALPYLMYGPPVYTAGGDQATPSAPEDRYPSVSSNAKIADTASEDAAGQSEKVVNGQAEGLKPEGCIMVNGNWCGFEVRSYTDEKGCWSSSAECWTQSKDCYDNAPPTGAKNCDLWGDKCNHLDDSCHAQQFYGPPDAGKDLTPTPPDLETTAAHKLMALVKKHENHHMRHAYRTHHQ